MRKLVLFIHLSLDGMAADPDNKINWVYVDEEMFDYARQQTDKADTALYGRVTYEIMQNYWPTAGDNPQATKHDKEHSAWYNSVEKIILSRSLRGYDQPKTTVISENVKENLITLKKKPGKHILMFGSPTAAHVLIQNDLIDEYWFFITPVVLGKGKPLFSGFDNKKSFYLNSADRFSSGVVALNYHLKT